MSASLITGDCMAVLPTLAEASMASVVTDPPYHLAGGTRFGNTRSTRGFPFVGTDITPEYIAIAARRIIHWRRDELFAVEQA